MRATNSQSCRHVSFLSFSCCAKHKAAASFFLSIKKGCDTLSLAKWNPNEFFSLSPFVWRQVLLFFLIAWRQKQQPQQQRRKREVGCEEGKCHHAWHLSAVCAAITYEFPTLEATVQLYYHIHRRSTSTRWTVPTTCTAETVVCPVTNCPAILISYSRARRSRLLAGNVKNSPRSKKQKN